METIDLTKVASVVDPDNKRLLYSRHKHLFTKIGFDVFQMNSSPIESYWLLEKDDNGEEYLVANYEKELVEEKLNAKSSWKALSDKESKNVTLLYKGVPIQRFASAEYGFQNDDVHIFKNALVDKLSAQQEFVNKLMEVLSEEKRNALVQAFPELAS